MHDVRLALRSARRSPGISLACALTLALGAGATTSALALLNGVVLKPLPVDRPRELVLFSGDTRDGVVFTGTPQGTLILFSTPSFEYLHAHQQTFTGVAAFQIGRDRVASRIDAATELTAVTRVSANYFSVLGIRAQAGRLFDTNDDRGGGLPAVVMSDACWLRRFQRDPAVIGRSVTLGTTSYTIAGVAARGFYGESMREPPDFWMPFAPNAATPGAYDEHHTWWLGLVGRLKPGVTMAQASVDVNARLQDFLIDEAGSTLTPERRDEIAHTTIALARGDLGRSSIRIRAIAPLTLLVVLVVLLLVAASTNVATLLVARATARDRVTTIHLMLGASRARVVRFALAETLAIAGPGLAAGIAVALTSPRLLLPLVTTAPLPIDIAPDARLIAMIAAAAAAAGVVACAGPVWRVVTADGRQMGRPLHLDSPPSHHLGRALVIVQMALAAPLLIVAGLLIRSVDRLEGQDLAVNRGHVLLVDFGPSLAASPERTGDGCSQRSARPRARAAVRRRRDVRQSDTARWRCSRQQPARRRTSAARGSRRGRRLRRTRILPHARHSARHRS
jgi:predicted permease